MPHPITAKCNFNCTFCDRQWSRDEAAPVADVLEKAPISELSGMRAVLGGGEPTLHPQLPTIFEGLREQGVRRIFLRTNAAWASREAPVKFLQKKGLTECTVLFPTHDPALFDALTRKVGAYDAVVTGILNLRKQGVRVSLRVPLLKPTLATLPDTLRAVRTLFTGVRRVDLVHLDISDPALQVSWEEIHAVFPQGSDTLGDEAPALYLDPGPGIPLCRHKDFPQWRLSPDLPTARGRHPSPCQTCFMRTACPGVAGSLVDLYGEGIVRPYGEDVQPMDMEPRRAPVPRSIADKAFETVKGMTYECPEDGDGEATLASVRLRVGHKCNRRCDFCFIPHHEKSVQDYDIPKSIEAAVQAGAREIVMTGGEPTLADDLPDFVEQARSLGARRVVLQTNATRLADPDFTQRLADAGLTSVVVSLHSHQDEVLSSITGLKNSLGRIERGLHNLHKAGIQSSITHVIGPKNFALMPEFVRHMTEQNGVRRYCFIFATPMAWPMARKDIIVRYSDAAPYMMEAMDWCIDQGIIVDGLSFKCGAPHCVVKGDPRYLVGAVPIPEQNRTPDWMRVPACATCSLKHQCYGVRRLYAWLYGTEEFQPVLEPGQMAEDRRPRLRIPAQPGGPAMAREMRTLVRTVGERIGVTSAKLDQLLAPGEVLSWTVNVDGQSIPAWRVRRPGGGRPDTLGALELSPQIDAEGCATGALMRDLRAAAFGCPIAGAHGGLAIAPEAIEGDEATVLQGWMEGLDQQLQANSRGRDFLTPHTSSPWSTIEAVADAGDLKRVGLLRRTPDAQRDELRMTSVDSAVAATIAGMHRLGAPKQNFIRYGVWGFGRAGRRFAKIIDGIGLFGGSHRPMLVACSDSASSWIDQNGLEHERIAGFKVRNGRLPAGPAGTNQGPDAVLSAPLDVLLLSGRGRALTVASASKVQARLVVDLTGQLAPDVERVLQKMGVLVVPSVLATAGPMILAELEHRAPVAPDVATVRAEVARRTAEVLERAIVLSNAEDLTMTEAVIGLGVQVLAGPRPMPGLSLAPRA